MKIDFDPFKNMANAEKHGISFELAAEFDLSGALIVEDKRHPYGETRFAAIGYIGKRLHFLCFKEIPDGIRVISLRKANKREGELYDKKIKNAKTE